MELTPKHIDLPGSTNICLEKDGKLYILWRDGRLADDENDTDKERLVRTFKKKLNANIVIGPAAELDSTDQVKILEDPKCYGIYVEADKIETIGTYYTLGIRY